MRAQYTLVDELSRPEGETARRRTQAARAVTAFPAPVALFGGISGAHELTNEAWRALFADLALPAELSRAIATRASGLLPELEVGGRYLSISVEPLRAASGALVVCLDVTDQTLARHLDVDVGALVWSPAGYANKAWQARVRARWQDAIFAGDMRRWLAVVQSVADGRRTASIDVRIVIDGVPRWHRVAVDARRGEVLCGATDIHDNHERDNVQRKLLAELRRARESAARADRLRDEFLAVISHELRTPLTTLLLWEKVLRENGDNERSRADALDAIHQSATQQVQMFGDLLDYARGSSGKLALDLRPIELNRIVDAAVEAVRAAAVEKSIDIAVHALTGMTAMQGDALRLRQVIDNVLSNAVKFTPRGGKIRISLARARSAALIEIEDNGPGIAPELASRVFEPFAQAQNALNRREAGLGLGLTIARQLVRLHRGSLRARQPRPRARHDRHDPLARRRHARARAAAANRARTESARWYARARDR